MTDQPTQHLQREKDAARQLRKTTWWQNIVANATCYYCQNPIEPDKVTMDHVVPLSQGGRSSRGNVVPCCKSCNTRKNSMTAVEWILQSGSDGADKS